MKFDWTLEQVMHLFSKPFNDLLREANEIHNQNFDQNEIQVAMLVNIKTGGCPENCSYCGQSAHFNTGLKKEPLISKEEVRKKALYAKEKGVDRVCLAAAYRTPRDEDLDQIIEMVGEIKALGLESCITLGMLKDGQAEKLKQAGLDFYNHNIDTSEDHYANIVTTRSFADRIDTLNKVQKSGLKICSGGILGMGETVEDRAKMLCTLASFASHPKSVPINVLHKVAGTPMEKMPDVDPLDLVRTIAVARIMMPKSYVRLSAGRPNLSRESHALCFFAGANSIFYGEKLLVTPNANMNDDETLFRDLGLKKKLA